MLAVGEFGNVRRAAGRYQNFFGGIALVADGNRMAIDDPGAAFEDVSLDAWEQVVIDGVEAGDFFCLVVA